MQIFPPSMADAQTMQKPSPAGKRLVLRLGAISVFLHFPKIYVLKKQPLQSLIIFSSRSKNAG
jgi:hypothetical protein